MKKVLSIMLILFFVCGCSVVRIDTESIDNILNVVLSKKNTLYNQVGQGYKYYVPGGVNFIESDEFNDTLYSNGTNYYLHLDVVNYYYKNGVKYSHDKNAYYSRKLDTLDGFKYNGYLKIREEGNYYYLEFVYNYAKIEAMATKKTMKDVVLNSAYILSTIKYNREVIELMLGDENFTNKTGKFQNFNSKGDSGKFELRTDN